MAARMFVDRSCVLARAGKKVNFQCVRHRWKPPDKDLEILPSFAQRLTEWKKQQEVPASAGVNIGFQFRSSTNSGSKLEKLRQWSTKRVSLEKEARHRQLKLDLNVMKEEWKKESQPIHVSRMAKHYGIFNDLFDGAYFCPVVSLDVAFDYDEEFVTPVCYGNVVPAAEVMSLAEYVGNPFALDENCKMVEGVFSQGHNMTAMKPFVSYDAEEDSLWTLVMTSPDGNLEDNKKELLHWFIGNIPGNAINKGETICDYLMPFPMKGVGYLRYVFILYKQNRRLDFGHLKQAEKGMSLQDRSFSTLEFYQQFEDDLTPAGLSFFQSQWDKSVRSVFHDVLDMPEPAFEFIHPPVYHPAQKDFPIRQPFNLYLDRYRDRKDIQEEVLKERLKAVDPTKPLQPKPKYPNIDMQPRETPSWLRIKIQNMRLGRHQWRNVEEESKE